MATATQDRGLANARSCVKCEYLGLLHVHRIQFHQNLLTSPYDASAI